MQLCFLGGSVVGWGSSSEAGNRVCESESVAWNARLDKVKEIRPPGVYRDDVLYVSLIDLIGSQAPICNSRCGGPVGRSQP